MKKFYIPTSSLNFNNVLSSESISPEAFYYKRSFGYGRWTAIPENPYKNSIVLYDQLCSFVRPKSDYEDHPLLFEIYLDETVESSLLSCGEHTYLSDHTIYIDPFSTSIYFFSDMDKCAALSLSDSSLETKVVKLYNKKIRVINPPEISFPAVDPTEKQQLNWDEINKDKRINKMKGLLYGYYIGAILSSPIEDVRKLNKAREIKDVLAAVLASFDHKATTQQRDRLKVLYSAFQPEVPFLSELASVIPEEDPRFDDIVDLVRREYGYIKGELNVDGIISRLLAKTSSDAKNPELESISSLIETIEKDIALKSKSLNVQDCQAVLGDDLSIKVSIDGVPEQDKALCEAWLNNVMAKDEYSGKTSTFKKELSDDVTKTAKSEFADDWDESSARATLNALRRHVAGGEYNHVWGNDIYSAVSAVILRGDDWQKLLQFMQEKEMTDYRIPFAMFGTLNGFAGIPRDFTDVLYGKEREYIADVYKEFYGQLFGRDVVTPPKNVEVDEIIPKTTIEEDMPDFGNEVQPVAPASIGEFDALMDELAKKCGGAKKDEKKYYELFIRYNGVNQDFVDAVCNESIFGKKVQKGVRQVLCKKVGAGKAPMQNPLNVSPEQDALNLFADKCESTGTFLSDFDFLVNNSEFSALMSGKSSRWKDDLKWFIDAHNPNSKDYKKYYCGKQEDNNTVVSQFVTLKRGKYRCTETFLRKTYNL